MKTRAQERAESVEPGPSQSQQASQNARKRRASATSDVSEVADISQPAGSQPMLKKRKKSKAIIQTTTLAQITNTQPSLPALVEEQVGGETPLQESQPSPPRITVTATGSRRDTLPPSAFSQDSLGVSGSSQRSMRPRKSTGAVTARLVQPHNYDPLMTSLNELIEKRLQQRTRSQTESQLDISVVEQNDQDQDMMVYGSTAGPTDIFSRIKEDGVNVDDDSSDRVDSLTDGDMSLAVKTDQERAGFEETVKRLNRELADAKATFDIYTVELQSMGFGGPDADPEAIRVSIRTSFDQVRHRLKDILPVQTSDEVLEHAMLLYIADSLVDYHNRNEIQEQAINKKDNFIKELLSQIDNLVDKLAEARLLQNRLSEANAQFEQVEKEDDIYVKELESKLAEINTSHEKLSRYLSDKVNEIKQLSRENQDLEANCDKLKAALGNYRESEANLHDIISRMEKDQADALAIIETNHSKEIGLLKDDAAAVRAARDAAESKAADSEKETADLAQSLQKEAETSNELKAQIADINSRLSKVEAERQSALKDAGEKAGIITDIKTQLADLQDVIAKRETDLAKVQKLAETERRQRESAETELDQTNVKAKALVDKLHKQGIEANELRQKLFEVQQRDQKTIEDITSKTTDRIDRLEGELLDEVRRREQAEALADNNDKRARDLQASLADLEKSMRKTLEDQETLLMGMEDRAIKAEDDLAAAKQEIQDKVHEYNTLRSDTTGRINNLEAVVRDLTAALSDANLDIVNIKDSAATQQQQMLDTLNARSAEITSLTAELDVANKAVLVLEKDKVSLERRVESEAEAMLHYTNEKESQITELNHTLEGKQAEITRLIDTAKKVDVSWNDLLNNRNKVVNELSTSIERREEELLTLVANKKVIMDKFKEYVNFAEKKMEGLGKEIDRLNSLVQGGEKELKGEGKRLLDEAELEATEDLSLGLDDGDADAVQTTPLAAKTKVTDKKKVRRVKRVRDSGFGGSSPSGLFS